MEVMDAMQAKEINQNLLRGAKSLADKIDLGCIIMPLRDFELEAIEIICKRLNCEVPTIGIHFYKNRRSQYSNTIIWCKNQLSTCKLKPMFATNYRYELLDIPDLKIIVKPE